MVSQFLDQSDEEGDPQEQETAAAPEEEMTEKGAPKLGRRLAQRRRSDFKTG